MSEDPKGFAAGDYNLFRYCHNDPEDLTDPMGLLMGIYQVDPRPPPPPPSVWVLGSHIPQPFDQAQKNLIMGPVGATTAGAQNTASVQYVGSRIERKSPDDIVKSKDPGVGPSTKSYTLMIVGNTIIYVDRQSGAVSVTIPVGAKTVLPNNTGRWDQKEAEQRVSIIEAVVKADAAVRKLAGQSFKDTASFQQTVEATAHRVLWTENRLNILQKDINQQW